MSLTAAADGASIGAGGSRGVAPPGWRSLTAAADAASIGAGGSRGVAPPGWRSLTAAADAASIGAGDPAGWSPRDSTCHAAAAVKDHVLGFLDGLGYAVSATAASGVYMEKLSDSWK